MSAPVKKGDLAIIINGFNGDKSPNIGKIVTVGVIAAEHPLFGLMVKVNGEGLVIDNMGVQTPQNWCNIPIVWLKKVNPPPIPEKAKTKELENA